MNFKLSKLNLFNLFLQQACKIYLFNAKWFPKGINEIQSIVIIGCHFPCRWTSSSMTEKFPKHLRLYIPHIYPSTSNRTSSWSSPHTSQHPTTPSDIQDKTSRCRTKTRQIKFQSRPRVHIAVRLLPTTTQHRVTPKSFAIKPSSRSPLALPFHTFIRFFIVYFIPIDILPRQSALLPDDWGKLGAQ